MFVPYCYGYGDPPIRRNTSNSNSNYNNKYLQHIIIPVAQARPRIVIPVAQARPRIAIPGIIINGAPPYGVNTINSNSNYNVSPYANRIRIIVPYAVAGLPYRYNV